MEVSLQQLFLVTALLAFSSGAVLAGVSVHYYVSRDIRGVRDDLMGRTRQRAIARVRTRADMPTVRPVASAARSSALRGWAAGGADGGSAAEVEDVETRPMGNRDAPVDEDHAATVVGTGCFRMTKDICLCDAKGCV